VAWEKSEHIVIQIAALEKHPRMATAPAMARDLSRSTEVSLGKVVKIATTFLRRL
jgi:hypothetical protein